jgi:hypothetical protein
MIIRHTKLKGCLTLLSLCFFSLHCADKVYSEFLDTSEENMNDLVYVNTGVDLTSTPYGEASGSTSVVDPATSTEVTLQLYLPPSLGLAINTSQQGNWAPGSTFGNATVPFSRFAVKESTDEIISQGHKEFIIYAIVTSSKDNIQMSYDTVLTLTHVAGASYGQITVNMSGFGSGGPNGYESSATIISGGSMDISSGLAGIRLEGDVSPSSLNKATDRAGAYTGTITVNATSM